MKQQPILIVAKDGQAFDHFRKHHSDRTDLHFIQVRGNQDLHGFKNAEILFLEDSYVNNLIKFADLEKYIKCFNIRRIYSLPQKTVSGLPPVETIKRVDYLMALAELTSKRGTCRRLQVGCVLVDAETNRIAAIGYNSAHKGNVHCNDQDCLMFDGHCIRCPHAEIAAITNLQRAYKQLYCYITHQPCISCFQALISANVTFILYAKEYKDEKREMLYFELLQNNINIQMKQYKG